MPNPPNWRRFGPDGLLIEFGDASTCGWDRIEAARKAVSGVEGLAEATGGFSTLLCEFEPGGLDQPEETARKLLQAIATHKTEPHEARTHEIPVRYEGPDLERVAAHTGFTTDEVIRLHAAPEYLVRIMGFMPGFPYLEGLDPALATPRLAAPRKRIEAGAVGIGGIQTGIYPVASPGGWNLIGRTKAVLFDPSKANEESFLLRAGDRLRFIPS